MLDSRELAFNLAKPPRALASPIRILQKLIRNLPSGLSIRNILFIAVNFLAVDPLVQLVEAFVEALLGVTAFQAIGLKISESEITIGIHCEFLE